MMTSRWDFSPSALHLFIMPSMSGYSTYSVLNRTLFYLSAILSALLVKSFISENWANLAFDTFGSMACLRSCMARRTMRYSIFNMNELDS